MELDLKNQSLIILKETLKAIQNQEPEKINSLSNNTIHTASTAQDKESITIAILIYALSKIYEREYSTRLTGWGDFDLYLKKELKTAIRNLDQEKYTSYENTLQRIFKNIKKLDWKLKVYIKSVMEKARINKASRIHEHGISLGRTAELLGVSKYELMGYIGKTFMSESVEFQTKPIKERIETARRLLS
jgi:hypothetical protein